MCCCFFHRKTNIPKPEEIYVGNGWVWKCGYECAKGRRAKKIFRFHVTFFGFPQIYSALPLNFHLPELHGDDFVQYTFHSIQKMTTDFHRRQWAQVMVWIFLMFHIWFSVFVDCHSAAAVSLLFCYCSESTSTRIHLPWMRSHFPCHFIWNLFIFVIYGTHLKWASLIKLRWHACLDG